MKNYDFSALIWLRIMCAGLAVMLSLFVIVGWHTENELLKRIHPSFVPMAYNTALAFAASGIGLFFIDRKFVPIILGFLIFVIGTITLSQYIIGIDMGFDRILFDKSVRMAPNTAFCFGFAGIALMLASLQKKKGIAELVMIVVSFVVFLLGCMAFLGYLFKMPSSYSWGHFIEMAFHTAGGFILLGMGLLAFGIHNYRANNHAKVATAPIFVLLLGTVLSIALWQYLLLREEQDVKRTVGLTQTYLGDYLNYIIDKEENILYEILFDFSYKPGMHLTDKISENVHKSYPLVAGFGTIDKNGAIDWGIALKDAAATESVENSIAANPNATGINTQSVEAPGARQGFIMSLPYYEDDVYLGSVFTVYNSEKLFENLFNRGLLDDFGVIIYEDDTVIYQNTAINDLADKRDLTQTIEIKTAGSVWKLLVWPGSRLVREIYSITPNIVFIFSLLLFATLAAIVQLGANLRESNKRVKHASKAKSDFLSSMSHELRTPLNAIVGYAQLLEYDKNLNEKAKESAKKIRNASNHLLSLINEILDLSKIEAGKLDISFEPIALDDILDECYELSLQLAEKFNIKLEFSKINTKINVKGDFFRLKQVLLNLISNAIKYNKNNGSVSILVIKTDDDRVKIGVRDTGLGMAQEQIDKLFEPFQRFAAEKSNIEGTGIGLTITKELVEKMHGTISVESVVGEGSTFWVELPYTRKKPGVNRVHQETNASELQNNESVSVKKYVLVAEDNPANQEIIQQQLDFLGYKCKVVGDGEEAYKAWVNEDFDLVLMDCNMPKVDGYEATMQIRKDEKGHDMHIPIIAFTANASQEDIQKCKDTGMDEILTKPVELESLEKALKKVTKPGESHEQ